MSSSPEPLKPSDPVLLSPASMRTVRILLVTLGAACTLTAILAAGFFGETPQPLQSRVLMALLGVVLIALGAALGRAWSLPAAMGRVLFGLMLVFLFSEAIGTTGLYVMHRLAGDLDPGETASIQREKSYRPYVIWRASPFSSRMLNIGHDGLRVVPGASDRPDAMKVFLFGGSTMLGWFTSDAETIAGRMQRLLSATTEREVAVTNFGQLAYVNTQEMIELQLQLREGNIPDLVLFYDGVNEVTTAVLSDTPGTHMDQSVIAGMYQDRQLGRSGAVRPSLIAYLSDLGSVRFVGGLLGMEDRLDRFFLHSEPTSNCWLYGEDYIPASTFAAQIMSIYEGNLRIIKALSIEYGFDYLVFWQPVLFTGDKPLTEREIAILESENAFLGAVCRECEAIALEMQERNPAFLCITDAFDDREEELYMDLCHLTALGDSLIAARIMDEVEAADLIP